MFKACPWSKPGPWGGVREYCLAEQRFKACPWSKSPPWGGVRKICSCRVNVQSMSLVNIGPLVPLREIRPSPQRTPGAHRNADCQVLVCARSIAAIGGPCVRHCRSSRAPPSPLDERLRVQCFALACLAAQAALCWGTITSRFQCFDARSAWVLRFCRGPIGTRPTQT